MWLALLLDAHGAGDMACVTWLLWASTPWDLWPPKPESVQDACCAGDAHATPHPKPKSMSGVPGITNTTPMVCTIS